MGLSESMCPIRVLIADDEPDARENLLLRLKNNKEFEICGQADNGNDVLLLAARLNPDVIFLDIQMPGLSGMDAAKELMALGPKVVFITAFSQYAVDAFRANAVDYLLKPIVDSQFEQTLAKIKQHLQQGRQVNKDTSYPSMPGTYLQRLSIRDRDGITMVNVSSIEHVETAGDYLCILADGSTHVHKQTLKSLLELLNPQLFIRVHRSHLVNLNFVTKFEQQGSQWQLVLTNGKLVRVSRRFQKAVKGRF